MTDTRAIFEQLARFKARQPVRREHVGSRDLEMSKWIRDNCRPSKRGAQVEGVELGAFVVSDIDWCLYDYEHRVLRLLEVKTRGGSVSFAQRDLLLVLDAMLRSGSGASDVRYVGLSVLRLEGTTPTDSAWIEWDGVRISKEECYRRINLLDIIYE